MTTGSCLCGAVRWHVDAAPEHVTHCHCSMCRKAHGAPFATYGQARAASVHVDAGADERVLYQSSPTLTRAFCGRCGSVVPYAEDEHVDLALGSLDGDPGARPQAHIFVASKAPWWNIEDTLAQHATWPDDNPGPVIERPVPGAPAAGVLRGSCLCGGVALEVREPIGRMFNCHCSRCRKARAAAHASNGFTSRSGVVFTHGEDLLASYKLPEARFFTQTFCTRCGSAMPRLDAARDIAVIPLGALDDDPGRGPGAHIFVASKAPWYDIPGDLPRYDEGPPPA